MGNTRTRVTERSFRNDVRGDQETSLRLEPFADDRGTALDRRPSLRENTVRNVVVSIPNADLTIEIAASALSQ